MIFNKYNITLEPLSIINLEKLRNWRNSDYVNSQMIYNEWISPEMQKKWFENLQLDRNFYFIAKFQDEDVGVIHIKNIVENSGEGGIFLIDKKNENSDIVPRMVACFNDYVFYHLKIKTIYSQVKSTNKKAISSSKAQGCQENLIKSTDSIIYFELFPENYEKKMLKIKRILK